MDRGTVVRVGVGDAYSVIASEGVGYSPDLVHDMCARAQESLRDVIIAAIETGYIPIEDFEEDEEEVLDGEETPGSEPEVNDGEIWWLQ